ncbi:AtaL-like protein [Streptomyces aureoversilis]|uniref:AtaL-like protein n=1 Tax=Streptomyces aureoversilis TaxID=67277 RepID=A0ABW0A1R3_9ACTN
MITLSWTRKVDTAADTVDTADAGVITGTPGTTREQLWRVLLHKAENPVGYVPAITECRVLERYEDGFLREARRGSRLLVQRVTPDEAAGRITFRHADSSDLAVITNQVGEDEDGDLTLTLSITLTEAPSSAVLRENSYLHELDSDFAATLDAMTAVLRRNATALQGAGDA